VALGAGDRHYPKYICWNKPGMNKPTFHFFYFSGIFFNSVLC
jgi:hypothetical protein